MTELVSSMLNVQGVFAMCGTEGTRVEQACTQAYRPPQCHLHQ